MTAKEFTETFLPAGDVLYKVAYYMLESGPDAEDAVQDLYIRLWDSRDTLKDIRNPKSYCVTLMKNLCIDRIRKASGKTPAQLDDRMTDESTTDSDVIGKDTARLVAQAIRSLPEGQRKVLHMRVSEELSNSEISARTGMSGLTVRVLMSQARKKLKTIITGKQI